MPVETTVYERVPVPSEYLRRHCEGVSLAEIETFGELEEAAAKLWICVQDHNADKDRIGALK